MTTRPTRFGVASVLLLGPFLTAQELRHADNPLFSSACYDSARARVIGVGLSGYSQEWDGVSWQRTPDRGSPYGWSYFDATAGALGVFVPSAAGEFDFHARIGNAWQSTQPLGGPSTTATMAFDVARGEVIAFGGHDTAGVATATWAFDGAAWTLRQPTTSPPARYGASIAFDSVRQVVVLFGGAGNSGLQTDTWEWQGTDWTQAQTATQPNAQAWSPMTYDMVRQRMVLLANTQPAGTSPGAGVVAHWEYDGANWIAMASPPAAIGGCLIGTTVYDEARAQTLVMHSSDAQARYDDVWAWNGFVWTQQPGFGQTPWAYNGAGVAANSATDELLVFGGLNASLGGTTAFGDTWRWNGTAWTECRAECLGTGGDRVQCRTPLQHRQLTKA